MKFSTVEYKKLRPEIINCIIYLMEKNKNIVLDDIDLWYIKRQFHMIYDVKYLFYLEVSKEMIIDDSKDMYRQLVIFRKTEKIIVARFFRLCVLENDVNNILTDGLNSRKLILKSDVLQGKVKYRGYTFSELALLVNSYNEFIIYDLMEEFNLRHKDLVQLFQNDKNYIIFYNMCIYDCFKRVREIKDEIRDTRKI